MEKFLKCPDCGSDLELWQAYSGCDWNSEKGEGSGFGWEVYLACRGNSCARVYLLGYTKELHHFVTPIEKLRPYK